MSTCWSTRALVKLERIQDQAQLDRLHPNQEATHTKNKYSRDENVEMDVR